MPSKIYNQHLMKYMIPMYDATACQAVLDMMLAAKPLDLEIIHRFLRQSTNAFNKLNCRINSKLQCWPNQVLMITDYFRKNDVAEASSIPTRRTLSLSWLVSYWMTMLPGHLALWWGSSSSSSSSMHSPYVKSFFYIYIYDMIPCTYIIICYTMIPQQPRQNLPSGLQRLPAWCAKFETRDASLQIGFFW